jgi:hypothetical protein
VFYPLAKSGCDFVEGIRTIELQAHVGTQARIKQREGQKQEDHA